jgi:hypothetical protein
MLKLMSQPYNLHDLGHGEHVDATHQHGHKGKRNRRERAGRFSETQLQISRHRVGFGDVIKRHHHQREKQHRWNGADPIPMSCENAVLIGGARPAHKFERTQIRREETQAGYPCGHLPTRHEEIFASVRPPFQVDPNGQHQPKIENDNGNVDGREMNQRGGTQHQSCKMHAFSPMHKKN